ncbi:MAG: 1-acyl-sn-glycerol-3-phosphate acyltransferase [Gemmatimonadetes bacterium]|nr:1-acyl-sn-glycerol-3-phosphate acyltransferase [Gemmatimonadota bacterium]
MREGSRFYRSCWWLALGLARLIFRVRIEGASRIPRGGLIVASNHASYADPPMVGVAAHRELFYVTKGEVFPIPVLGWLLRRWNAIPIDRSRGDRAALSAYEGKLLEGKAVFIAPEGTRNKARDFLPPKPGVGMLVYRTGVPVLPAYVSGTRNLWRTLLGWEPIVVRFGAAVYYDRSQLPTARRLAYQAISQDVMHKIDNLRQSPTPTGTVASASHR